MKKDSKSQYFVPREEDKDKRAWTSSYIKVTPEKIVFGYVVYIHGNKEKFEISQQAVFTEDEGGKGNLIKTTKAELALMF